MKKLLACAALLVASPALAAPPPIESDGYRLVWSREFDTDGRPDPDTWTYERGFSRNNELQWYQEDNAFIEGGSLVIEARRERVRNPGYRPGADGWRQKRRYAEYTSSSLTTRESREWLYGRFELRAKIDIRPGMWPAWWTVGRARAWPGSGEIDMMEYYRGMILANAAWKSRGGDRWSAEWDSVRVPVEDLAEGSPESWADEFHVWRMDWTEDAIRLYLDGELLNEIDLSETINPDGSNPFREPHFMLINLAIGGNNGGDPSETEFPARYEIDYVRVYQRDADASEGAGG
ncbi:MAG: glycoside hydrolase family 16 protein [Planctomycetota bacterium]